MPKSKKKLKGLITATNYTNFVNCQLTSFTILEATPNKEQKQVALQFITTRKGMNKAKNI
jgi:hypothetical protein